YIPKLQIDISNYKITKVAEIIPGGKSGQESIFLGLQCAKKYSVDKKDIVLIHDGVRPLVTLEEISKNLAIARKYGNAISASKTYETIALKGEKSEIKKVFNREECMVAKAPQSFVLEEIWEIHNRAKEERRRFIDTASMANFYGIKLYFVECSVCNVKLTTPMDYYLIQSIMKTRDVESIFGI
ncbi:MAG: 2-C-methyl-D-erythritol 4-phosphate cytidylyltransferase, partial [Helicobacter sp.]|nr:2-C-methyl-D-erythritol 4-phosphate cytidylyltransferase [Helicobacter sp.]